MDKKRKIIQIIIDPETENATWYALTDDGVVWELDSRGAQYTWEKSNLPEIPQDES